MTPGDLRGPGHVASHGMAYTPFDALRGDGPAASLAAKLNGEQLTLTDAAGPQVWQKAAFNCAMNATAVLGAGTVGDIADHIGAELAQDIAAEVLAIGAAEGVAGDLAAVRKKIDFALREHKAHKPPMLQDVEAGRRTEIEALNGYVDRAGQKHGIAVPLNRLLASLVRMREQHSWTFGWPRRVPAQGHPQQRSELEETHTTVPFVVDNKDMSASNQVTFDRADPVTGEAASSAAAAQAGDAKAVAKAAGEAFPTWAATGPASVAPC